MKLITPKETILILAMITDECCSYKSGTIDKKFICGHFCCPFFGHSLWNVKRKLCDYLKFSPHPSGPLMVNSCDSIRCLSVYLLLSTELFSLVNWTRMTQTEWTLQHASGTRIYSATKWDDIKKLCCFLCVWKWSSARLTLLLMQIFQHIPIFIVSRCLASVHLFIVQRGKFYWPLLCNKYLSLWTNRLY